METIAGKGEIKQLTEHCIAVFQKSGADALVAELQTSILNKKCRFPLLEYAAKELYKAVPEKQQVKVTDRIIDLQELGGNVLAGIILQLRLPAHLDESISKAVDYIIQGDAWYVCDIIGERVMGHALLTQPGETLPVLQKLAAHPNKWIVRSVGVAGHYAIKKGLKKMYVAELFRLLLSLSNTTDFHTKKGIGWATKTTAKFHPEIIAKYRTDIDSPLVKQWFKTKVKIGLGRSEKYASRYTG